MKKAIQLFSLFLLASCSHPSIEKDGGVQITLEAAVGDYIKHSILPSDSLAMATIYETYKDKATITDGFLKTYLKKLQQSDPNHPVGVHFQVAGINASSNTQAVETYFLKQVKEQLNQTILVLHKRMESYEIANAVLRASPNNERIIVELTGKMDSQRVRKLLQNTAKLSFYETYSNQEVYSMLMKLNTDLSEELYPQLNDSVVEEKNEIKPGASLDEQFAAQTSAKEIQEAQQRDIEKKNPLFFVLSPSLRYDGSQTPVGLTDGPIIGFSKAKDTAKVNALLKSATAQKIFGRYFKFLWTIKSATGSQDIYQLLAVRTPRMGKSELSGNIVLDSKVYFDSNDNSPQISLQLIPEAAREWQLMTKNNVGKSIAIAIDDQVYSYPLVNSEIPGGATSISGSFSLDEAQDFANVLKAGCLPIAVHIVDEVVVAPKGK